MEMHELSATSAAAAIACGDMTCLALAEACLARIENRDALVGAWSYVDANASLAAAVELDAARAGDRTLGPLHGVPVGIKDIFDTADMPTECGSELFRGRVPKDDAAAVATLRDAGAIVIGKTVTAELALSAPGHTANPLDPRRTPGGSSSGSAAAVADCMVPLAIGSQTTGSVIRPASYCGIFGFKPSFGAISTSGMHLLSQPLDHVGVFARHLEDISLIAEVLMPTLRGGDAGAGAQPGRRPHLGVVRAPVWNEADRDARARFDAWAGECGLDEVVELGALFDDAVTCQRIILDASLAANLGDHYGRHPERMRANTRARVRDGLTIGASTYIHAMAYADRLRARIEEIFRHFDALVTLAAPGEAPLGHGSTGNAVFSAIWTLLGVPAISVPMLTGENGLPIGVQIIGARNADAHLLAVARAVSRWSET